MRMHPADWFGKIATENYSAKTDAEIQVVGGLLAAPKRSLFLCGMLGVKLDYFRQDDTRTIWIVGAECGRENLGRNTALRLTKGVLINLNFWDDTDTRPWMRGPMWSVKSLVDLVLGVGNDIPGTSPPQRIDAHLNLWCPRLVEVTERLQKVQKLIDQAQDVLCDRVPVRAATG